MHTSRPATGTHASPPPSTRRPSWICAGQMHLRLRLACLRRKPRTGIDVRARPGTLKNRMGSPILARGPLAQRQSNGLLIRRFRVRIPGGPPASVTKTPARARAGVAVWRRFAHTSEISPNSHRFRAIPSESRRSAAPVAGSMHDPPNANSMRPVSCWIIRRGMRLPSGHARHTLRWRDVCHGRETHSHHSCYVSAMSTYRRVTSVQRSQT